MNQVLSCKWKDGNAVKFLSGFSTSLSFPRHFPDCSRPVQMLFDDLLGLPIVAARTSPSDFLQKSFCEVFPRFILFSNHHSKAGYIKEPLVLLISQRLVGNVAQMASPVGSESRSFGTISPAWAQGTASHLVAARSYLLCLKNNKNPTFSKSKTLWEFDSKVSPRYLCVPKQCICVCSQPSAPGAAWSILQAGSARWKLWNK